MKKILFTIIIIFAITGQAYNTYAVENETQEELLKEQEQNFGITSFIENSKKYTGDFFEGIDINEIFQTAVKGEEKGIFPEDSAYI